MKLMIVKFFGRNFDIDYLVLSKYKKQQNNLLSSLWIYIYIRILISGLAKKAKKTKKKKKLLKKMFQNKTHSSKVQVQVWENEKKPSPNILKWFLFWKLKSYECPKFEMLTKRLASWATSFKNLRKVLIKKDIRPKWRNGICLLSFSFPMW
jgi:hypothetical protein